MSIQLKISFIFILISSSIVLGNNGDYKTGLQLPDDFLIGASTAAYQIEGAWNTDGKGPNIWDEFTHREPHRIYDQSNGDVAANSYELFEEDVKLLKNVGMNFYRFSIAWSRVLPTGDISVVNQAGVTYYNKLINALLENGIEPMVTMYHYDLPQALAQFGGFTNPIIVDYFAAYADLLFGLFGDRVKYWMTFNEPLEFCIKGYGKATHPPQIHAPGVGEYLCLDTILKAHATAYRLYRRKYYKSQNGKVSITISSQFTYPVNSTTDVINEHKERSLQFQIGWVAHAIYKGGYPPVMRHRIDTNSRREGRTWSRLPQLSSKWVATIKGTTDFFSLNYYTSRQVVELNDNNAAAEGIEIPSWSYDLHLSHSASYQWKQSQLKWLYSVPEGMGDILRWIKKEYKNPEVIISENGWSDDGRLNDVDRVKYLKDHLSQVVNAVRRDGCNVKGYTVWSILDNFEWLSGYIEKFGLHYVNFTSPGKERTPKWSADFIRNVNLHRIVPQD